MSKVTLVYLAISLGDGGVFMLMALVLETPYSKVFQLGLLQLSPLTVGFLYISQHGYRRRRVFLLFKWAH